MVRLREERRDARADLRDDLDLGPGRVDAVLPLAGQREVLDVDRLEPEDVKELARGRARYALGRDAAERPCPGDFLEAADADRRALLPANRLVRREVRGDVEAFRVDPLRVGHDRKLRGDDVAEQ